MRPLMTRIVQSQVGTAGKVLIRIFLLLTLCTPGSLLAEPQPSEPLPLPRTFVYRGFTIDASATNSPPAPAILASAKLQVDIVLSVRLKSDVVGLFQELPIKLVPAAQMHGRYSKETGIEIAASDLSAAT